MQSADWNIPHYLIAAALITVYGGAVCPFIDTLSLSQLITPISIAFGAGLIARKIARNELLQDCTDRKRPFRGFIIELAVLEAVAIGLAVYNAIHYAFPFESGSKLLIGVGAAGFFIAMDGMLKDELHLGQKLKDSGIDLQTNTHCRSFTRRFMLLNVTCILIIVTVLLLLINKELFVLSQQESISQIAELQTAVMLESVFIVAVVVAYVLKVIFACSRMLSFYLGNQQTTLQNVTDGIYESKVPVVSNDEFGEIAKHTNLMISAMEARSAEIERTQDVAIMSLASLAETRDNETGAHIMRTQRYVKALADYLASTPKFSSQLDSETIELLFKSAPLHDIGKVGIPDSILLKPGKLSVEEFEIMKTHTILGTQALEVAESDLETTSFLRYAKEIAISHHERWDGNGYPNKLSGEEIPLSGRLMAVADVYDALISKRVYKPAFSHEKSRDIIVEGSGSHFDPDVVEAFLACEQQFIDIARNYSDDNISHAA